MTTTCKNCKAVFTGKFCNQCGQKASVNELSGIPLEDEVEMNQENRFLDFFSLSYRNMDSIFKS